MKVHIEDDEALSAVSPASLSAYVRAQGWTRLETYGDSSDIYDKSGSTELILPTTVEIADYPSVISEILRRLAQEENRAELQVFRDLSVADCDVIRNRVPFAEGDGSVKLDDGVSLFVQSRELLLAAACAAKEPKMQYRAGGIKDASDYMERVRLGQTEQGSFVATLLTPVPVNLEPSKQASFWPVLATEPYERQVTRTLVDSLLAAKRAASSTIKGSGLEAFRAGVSHGVSVNSCAALSSLIENGHGLDVSVTWARTRPAPEARSVVRFNREEGEIFKEAARYLREVEPRPDERIDAFVVKLDRGQAQDEGRVSFKTFLDGRPVSISAILSPELFRIASIAIAEKQSVTVRGDLVREGQRWHLKSPRNLQLVDEYTFDGE